MIGADLNREQWHEDPFAEKSAEVRAQWGENKRAIIQKIIPIYFNYFFYTKLLGKKF